MILSPESTKLCDEGPFAAADLAPLLSGLATEIATHGEVAVVQRCQIARTNCATNMFAVECVKAYYGRSSSKERIFSEMARRAMTPEELAAGIVGAVDSLFAPTDEIGGRCANSKFLS